MWLPTWSHTAFLSRFHAGCRSPFTTDGVGCWGEPCGEPAISLHSYHVSLVQWTACLLPVRRDPGSNPQGVLMWNWDSPVTVVLSGYNSLTDSSFFNKKINKIQYYSKSFLFTKTPPQTSQFLSFWLENPLKQCFFSIKSSTRYRIILSHFCLRQQPGKCAERTWRLLFCGVVNQPKRQ